MLTRFKDAGEQVAAQGRMPGPEGDEESLSVQEALEDAQESDDDDGNSDSSSASD
jgi:hypothetical protein